MEARASTAPILLAEMAAKACFLDTWISCRSVLKKSASQSELWMWGKHVTLEGLVLRCIELELMPILPCSLLLCKIAASGDVRFRLNFNRNGGEIGEVFGPFDKFLQSGTFNATDRICPELTAFHSNKSGHFYAPSCDDILASVHITYLSAKCRMITGDHGTI